MNLNIYIYIYIYIFIERKNKLDAQFIFSIFHQSSLHVSGVSIAYHQEVQPYGYNNWYLLFFLEECLLLCLGWNSVPTQQNRQSSKKNNKYQLLYQYGLPPDDGL